MAVHYCADINPNFVLCSECHVLSSSLPMFYLWTQWSRTPWFCPTNTHLTNDWLSEVARCTKHILFLIITFRACYYIHYQMSNTLWMILSFSNLFLINPQLKSILTQKWILLVMCCAKHSMPVCKFHLACWLPQVRTRAEQNFVIPANMDEENELACSVCKRRVPPRTFHCRVCQACVIKRDHHCVWYDTYFSIDIVSRTLAD